jgi:hypothetical protein
MRLFLKDDDILACCWSLELEISYYRVLISWKDISYYCIRSNFWKRHLLGLVLPTIESRERDTMETTMEKETPWKQQWRERDTMETTMEIDFNWLQIWSIIVKGSFILHCCFHGVSLSPLYIVLLHLGSHFEDSSLAKVLL